MRSKKVLGIVVVNAFIAATFLTTQNCGRVLIAEPIVEKAEIASLAVSVSSELVVRVTVNKPEVFSIPTNEGSAQVQSLSFDPVLDSPEMTTDLEGKVTINPDTLNLSYTPAVGLIGTDRAAVYVTGSDGSKLSVNVLFVVNHAENNGISDLNALVYGSSADDRIYLENKLAGYEPPGMSEIFYKWGRFSKNLWYNSAKEIKTLPALAYCNSGVNLTTGQFNNAVETTTNKTINPGTHAACVNNPEFVATSWVLMQSPERIFCPANAGVVTGFVSPLSFEYYKHEAIVTSTNGDDDTIGVVIAFHRDDLGNNHVLAAVRTQGGNTPGLGWGIVYYKNGSIVKVFGEKSVGGVFKNATSGGTGWSGRMSKIRVVREGNLISATASPWNMTESSLTLADDSKILLNLGDTGTAAIIGIFKGAKPYGYMTLSQLGSDYRGVDFSTGSSDNYVYDLQNKIVYEKQASGIYVKRTDLDAFTHIGAPRKVGNPDTGKIFQLNVNKTYQLIN